MGKKIIVTIFSLMIAGICFSAEASTFEDVNGHWSQVAIEKWEKYDVIKGVGNNTFNPNGSMTRAEIATVISRLINFTDKTDISAFSDIHDNDWYKEAFEKCVAAGIFKGDGNKLRPNSPVTREMFFTLLARTFEIVGERDINKSFDDVNEISDWAQESTYAMINNGYVNGVTSNKLEPKQPISRASVMVLINRIVMNYVIDDNVILSTKDCGISIIKSNNCKIIGGYFGTLFFASPNISATFEMDVPQKIIIENSDVTIVNVPIGSEVIIKPGVKNTVINGTVYNRNGIFTVTKNGEITDQKSEDSKHEHILCEKIKENIVSGNCKTKASFDEVVYCLECEEEISRKTVTGDYGEHGFENNICNFCGTVNQEISPIIIVNSISAMPGEQIEIKVNIKNNPGILGAILNFKYDSKLQLTDTLSGEAFSALEMTKPGKYVSDCNFVWDGLDEAAEKDGDIITLCFTISLEAYKGEKLKIECSYLPGDIINADFQEEEISVVNGTVTVK